MTYFSVVFIVDFYTSTFGIILDSRIGIEDIYKILDEDISSFSIRYLPLIRTILSILNLVATSLPH